MKPAFPFLILAAVLSSCLPRPETVTTPTARPTPETVMVGVSPYVRGAGESVANCTETLNELAVVVQAYPDSGSPEAYDLRIELGFIPNDDEAKAPLGQETLMLVLHPDHPLTEISLEDLKAIFSGKKQFWKELAAVPGSFDHEIHIWQYPPSSTLRKYLENLGLVAESSLPVAFIAPDPLAVVEAVGADIGAIGFVPGAWVDARVKTIYLSTDQPDSLRIPLWADGDLKSRPLARLVSCLQGENGQRAFRTYYQPWN